MKTVFICSPFAGDTERNIDYARRALHDSLHRGEAPYASHLLYPQVLDDAQPAHREMATQAAFSHMFVVDLVAVYKDLGLSPGMQAEIRLAESLQIPLEYRSLA